MTSDLAYAFSVVGGATLFALAWWAFCLTVRGAIDGGKAVARFVRSGKRVPVRKWLIGGWR